MDGKPDSAVIHLTAKKIFIIIVSLQLALLGLIGLDKLGLGIPILRQAVGFIYLTLVPGFLILRLLRINNKVNLETLLYSVGLSLSFLMFTGALINSLYPLLGITKPISEIPLIVTISIIVVLLCFIWYSRERRSSTSFQINIEQIFSPCLLSLSFLPFLAVFGTYLINFYSNNGFLLVLLTIISIIPIVGIALDKFSKELFPFIVWIISISLLLHTSLVSPYIWGADTNFEMYHISKAIDSHLWNPVNPNNHNAMLSLVMLGPIFTILLQMNITWVFKIIYPLLFSLIPVGLYKLFKDQTNEKIAFLSSFFFMSVPIFYTEMLALAKQQIAEFFLVVIFLLLMSGQKMSLKENLLLLIFGFSLVVSHYGTSYWFMFSILASFIFLFLKGAQSESTLRFSFVGFYVVLTITWYIYISSGSPFESAVFLVNNIMNNLEYFFAPSTAEGFDIITNSFKPIMQVTIYLNVFSQLLILLGIFTLFAKKERTRAKFTKEYKAFSLVAFIWDIAAIGVPYLTYGGFGATRLYHLSLFVLSPFFVIGFIQLFKWIAKYTKEIDCPKIISVFLMLFLLFNTQVISELAGYELSSQALSYSHDWEKSTEITDKIKFHNWYTNEMDVSSSTWLGRNKDDRYKIYSDMFRSRRLHGYGEVSKDSLVILTNRTKVEDRGYIYLGTFNRDEGLLTYTQPAGRNLMWWNLSEILPNLEVEYNKIYTNSGSEIYYR